MHQVIVKGPETDDSARDANFWIFDGRGGEFKFVLDQFAEVTSGPVLELGSGGGRLTQSLARAGLTVVGLELCDAMLEEANRRRRCGDEGVRRRLTYIKGDMRCFRMSQELSMFSMVIVPFSTFWRHMTREEAANCLACIKKVLQPGGRFLIDTPQQGHPDYDTPERPFWDLHAAHLGFTYDVTRYPLTSEQTGVMLIGRFHKF